MDNQTDEQLAEALATDGPVSDDFFGLVCHECGTVVGKKWFRNVGTCDNCGMSLCYRCITAKKYVADTVSSAPTIIAIAAPNADKNT